MIQKISIDQALRYQSEGRDLALTGHLDEACFQLSLAARTFREAGRREEYVRTRLYLAWCQDVDGRPWQAARTLQQDVGSAEFAALPPRVKCRALNSYARALWSLGEYSASLNQAEKAYGLTVESPDRGRAALAVAQAALSLGQVKQATEAFRQAVELDPSLSVSAYSIRAYLLNLTGRHSMALREADAGLAVSCNAVLENTDNTTGAVEFSALLVERGTAKAFLGHRDARQAAMSAREALMGPRGHTELEIARINRAMALIIARRGEHNAALALLTDASRVFARRGAQAEYGLTSRVYNYIARTGGVKRAESAETTGRSPNPALILGGRGRGTR